jgi:dipeptide/tripeptide permease
MSTLLGEGHPIFYNSINIAGTIVSLICYIWAKRQVWKVTFTCLYVLFLVPLITVNTENWIYDEVPYFLPFLIHTIIIVTPLYLIEIINERKKKSDQT